MNFQFDFNFFLNLLIPVLTSFAVCFITIFFTNRQHKKNLMQQEKHHKETLELSKQQYNDDKKRNKEQERLSYFPYLTIVPKLQKNRFVGEMVQFEDEKCFYLPFELVNEGMGVAFSIRLIYVDKVTGPNADEINVLTPISVQRDYDGFDVLGISAPIFTDILRVGNKTEFELYWSRYEGQFVRVSNKSVRKWEIKIQFSDFQNRNYEQKYTFLTSAGSQEIHNFTSEKPKLIK